MDWSVLTSNDDFRRALDSAQELEISFLGGKTGKRFSIPVWFVISGDKLQLLPVRGTKSNWYKGILKNPMMDLEVSGKKISAESHPIQDTKTIEEIMDRFRSKYGAGDVKRYYPGQNAAVELQI
jgi:hypothetical protein